MRAEGETCTGVASCKELGLKLGLDGHECVAVCDVAIEEKTGELRCVGGCPQWHRQVDGFCKDYSQMKAIIIVVPVAIFAIIFITFVAAIILCKRPQRRVSAPMRDAVTSE